MDELITIEPYNPEWQTWYQEETAYLQTLFDTKRLISLEHYGSTAVPDLAAKPTIGILAGFNSFPLTTQEQEKIIAAGYQFSKELEHRIYWRKNTPHQFTLATTQFGSESWHDHIAIRDYLRANTAYATAYAAIKYEAMALNKNTSDSYRLHKKSFLEDLFIQAKQWQRQNQ